MILLTAGIDVYYIMYFLRMITHSHKTASIPPKPALHPPPELPVPVTGVGVRAGLGSYSGSGAGAALLVTIDRNRADCSSTVFDNNECLPCLYAVNNRSVQLLY